MEPTPCTERTTGFRSEKRCCGNRLESYESSALGLVSVVRRQKISRKLLEKILNDPGITLANKIQRAYKLEDFIEHVIYEKNVICSALLPSLDLID